MKNIYLKIFYWLIIILLAFFIHWHYQIDADEGIILTGAWRVSEGEIPYIDFFDFITPGSFYFLAIFFKIFGATYLVAKVISILFLISSAYGIYLISQFIIKRKLCQYIVPIIWLILSSFYPLINHNQFSTFVLIWAFYFFLKSYRTNSSVSYFITGILSGLTFWFLQVRGAVIIFTIILLTVVYNFKNIKKIIYYIIGLIISLLPFLYWPLSLLWFNLIKFPFIHYLPTNQVISFSFVWLLVVYTIIAFGILKQNKKEIQFIWWFGLFLLLSVFHRSDIFHITIQLWPLLIIIFWQFEFYSDKFFQRWLLIAINSVIFFSLINFFLQCQIDFFRDLKNITELKNWLNLKNQDLDEIVSYIQNNTKQTDYIYSGPFLPNLYFEAKRKNPTRFNLLFTTVHPQTFFLEATADLSNKKPVLLLLYYEMTEKFNHSKDNPLDNYIWNNYQLVGEIYGIQILERNK